MFMKKDTQPTKKSKAVFTYCECPGSHHVSCSIPVIHQVKKEICDKYNIANYIPELIALEIDREVERRMVMSVQQMFVCDLCESTEHQNSFKGVYVKAQVFALCKCYESNVHICLNCLKALKNILTNETMG